jgi:NADH-quinone oxidoreductase subunit B
MGLRGDRARDDAPPAVAETAPPESVFTTTLDKMVRWARAGSLWPLPFGTACCAIEFMSVVSSHYDLARFGAEVVRFSPRQSDMMIVAGTVVDKQAPILKLIYEQMASPKWVISMGVCASSGGFYRAYHVMQGIDEIIPVDVYVPGCPPTPEGLIYAILKLQEKIERGDPSHYQIVADREAAEARKHRLVGA